MPRASETVLEAGLSYREGWENRLTAILAAVLDQHAGFASALFERVGLPTGDVYEAYTEEWVTPDRRVDMQVLAKDTRGAVVAQIWSEHKRIGGGFGTNQREDYLAALEREAGEGRLLTGVADSISENAEADDEPVETANDKTDADGIAIGAEDELPSRPGEPSPEEPRWWGMTWQLLAEIAEGAGQAHPEPWGGPGWADTAVRGEAPAAQRALYELLWYLEQEGYAVVAPVAAEHVQALKHAADTFDVSLALVSRAADRMSPLVPDGETQMDEDLHGYWRDFVVEGLWPERFDAAIELLLWDDDGWTDSPQGEPSVAIGLSFDSEWHRPLSKNPDWVHRIRAAGFCFAEYDEWLCCYATIPLSEVVEKGGRTIAEQSHYIASWARRLVQRLVSEEFDPGPVESPAKPKRGRRGKTTSRVHADEADDRVELTWSAGRGRGRLRYEPTPLAWTAMDSRCRTDAAPGSRPSSAPNLLRTVDWPLFPVAKCAEPSRSTSDSSAFPEVQDPLSPMAAQARTRRARHRCAGTVKHRDTASVARARRSPRPPRLRRLAGRRKPP